MANTIKLKRGSGSDPGASDLSVGEIAIRTDSGKLFTKKDDGSVAEISGSGGIDDGDKGDITVSNSGGTFTIDNGVVTSAKILDGTIVNGDIAAGTIGGSRLASGCIDNSKVVSTAAIDGSKISPAFTSDITGTGDLTLTSTDTGSSASPIIELYRNSASPADADYLGQLKFTGESDDGSKEVYAKITGKIDDASSGTEDGIIEIAHRKDGSNNISARFTSETLKLINGTGLEVAGATTMSDTLTISNASPNLLFTESDANPDFGILLSAGQLKFQDTTNTENILTLDDDKIQAVKNLDALNGIDVTGNISCSGTVDGRDVASDGTKLDGIESNATADMTASEILTLIKTVDGAGSGLDADTLDGVSSDGFVAVGGDTMTGNLIINNSSPSLTLTDNNNNPDYQIGNANGTLRFRDVSAAANRMTITSSAVDINVNLDANSGLDVTGDAAISGSVTAPRISGSNGIVEMKQEIGTSQTLTSGYNAIAVDPTIANGVTITVPSGAVWSIV